GAVFVSDPKTGQFVLERDIAEKPAEPSTEAPLTSKQLAKDESEYKQSAEEPNPTETAFHQFMHSPARLTLPGDEKSRNKLIEKNPKLKAAVSGKGFVKVKAEDIGVEAIDDYTVRICLAQSAPFFTGMMSHQFFRLVPRKAIEQFGEHWTDP